MTSKDKTGDQLMASIRKTKTEGTAPQTKAAVAPQAPAPAATTPAVRKKAVPKATPAAARPRTTTKKTAAKPRPQTAAGEKSGAYQSSKRVWPD